MDDKLLADLDADNLAQMFEEAKKILPWWELQITPKKNTKRRLY